MPVKKFPTDLERMKHARTWFDLTLMARPWTLNAERSQHWSANAERIEDTRYEASVVGRQNMRGWADGGLDLVFPLPLPVVIYVEFFLAGRRGNLADAGNYYPAAKAAIDGLQVERKAKKITDKIHPGCGIIVDDGPRWVHGVYLATPQHAKENGMKLTVCVKRRDELTDEQLAKLPAVG